MERFMSAIRHRNLRNGFVSTNSRRYQVNAVGMYKYKLNDVKRKYVTRVWAGRTAEERKLIGIKIGDAQKQHMESLTKDERRKVTEKARASIDRSVQGPAASKGLKNWWIELKKDAVAEKRKCWRLISARLDFMTYEMPEDIIVLPYRGNSSTTVATVAAQVH